MSFDVYRCLSCDYQTINVNNYLKHLQTHGNISNKIKTTSGTNSSPFFPVPGGNNIKAARNLHKHCDKS